MPHYVGDGCELLPPESARAVAHVVAIQREQERARAQRRSEVEQRTLRGREPSEPYEGPERRSGWRLLLDRLGLRSTGRQLARHPEGGRE